MNPNHPCHRRQFPKYVHSRLVTTTFGFLCLAGISLQAAPASAQPNNYAEDWNRLTKIIGFVNDGFGYASGAKSAIAWLTGSGNPAPGPTLDEIKETVVGALQEIQSQDLVNQVNGIATNFSEIKQEAAVWLNLASAMNMSPEQSMGLIAYLSDRMSQLANDSNNTLTAIQTILNRQAISSRSGYLQERQAVAVLPAFIVLIPLRAALMKLIGELVPNLATAEAVNTREMFQSAGAVLYKAVGTYSIAYTAGGRERHSPVGLQQNLMFGRLLYSYYHRLDNHNLNTYPALRFSQYQQIPIVYTALNEIQNIQNWLMSAYSRNLVVPQNGVWGMERFSDPNAPKASTYFVNVTGWVYTVWTCDVNESWCPQIWGQGN